MTGVPDDLVARRFEDAVESDCELDGSEAGRDVATGPLHRVDRELADVPTELQQLVLVERAYVTWIVDALEHRHRAHTTGACWISRLTRRSSPARPGVSAPPCCVRISRVGRTSPPRCATRPKAKRSGWRSVTSPAP